MTRLFRQLLRLSLLVIAMPMQASLIAVMEQDNLRINNWLDPVEELVTGQQISLQIEISTALKWQGGTTIDHVEIKDAIVLQREKFSVNSVRNEEGKSWLVQLWTLVIYPQSTGDYYLPEIAVNVAVVDNDGNTAAGQIKTPKLGFSVLTNPNIDNAEWIATPSFSIEESFDHSLEDIKAGDAIARTLVFNAKDLPAMMLPSMALEKLSGIATYSQPPKLVDKVNRGDYLAQRTEVHTYVIETSGDYLLPEQVYYWWNTQTKSLEKIVLPEYTLHVASTGLPALIWQALLIVSMVSLLVFLLFKLSIVKKIAQSARWQGFVIAINTRMRNPQKELKQRFKDACDQGNEELALAILYQGLDSHADNFHSVIRQYLVKLNNQELIQQFEVLMQAIYKKQDNKQENRKGGEKDKKTKDTNIRFFAENLLAAIKKSKAKHTGWLAKVDLTLN